MSDVTIASTWGYDQLLPNKISIISEKRLYSMPDQEDLFAYDKEDPYHHRLSHHLREDYLEDSHFPHSHHTMEIIEKTPERTPEYHEPTEYEHEFTIVYRDASKIFIAGEFNEWKPTLEIEKSGRRKVEPKAHLPDHQGNNTIILVQIRHQW
jgi:hypothetical protein